MLRHSSRHWVLPLALFLGVLLPFSRAAAVLRDGGIDPANLGKGDWIYFMSAATNRLGGNIASVTNENSLMVFFKTQGICYIIIKAATSDLLFNGSYSTPQFTSNLVNIAHAHGILIMGYNRSYGENIAAEIAIADYVFNQGADGFVWDAEAEWENTQPWIGANGSALAWQMCSTVRSNWPNKFLAHAPFPIISYHASFPYKEFGYWSDTVMPQIYPQGWTGVKSRPSGGINWTDVNWYNWQNSLYSLPPTNINGLTVFWTNAIKPLAPVNHVYGPNPPNSGVTQIPDEFVMEFMDYLAADPHAQTAAGYKGANFWRADLHGSAQWTNIKAGTSGDFTGSVNNIVIDNPRATTVGGWTSVRVFYDGSYYGATGTDTNSFGTNYLTIGRGTGSRYAEFRPDIITPGYYDVYQWHVYRTNASAAVPFAINYDTGSTTVYASQQTNAGKWSLLGRFRFAAGTNGYVRIMDNIPEPNAVAIADGLKLTFVNIPVPSFITNVTAQARPTSAIISWTTLSNATSQVEYGVTTNYGNLSPLDATLTTDHAVLLLGLIKNTNYFFRVTSRNGTNVVRSAPFAFSTDLNLILDNPQAEYIGNWTLGTSSLDKYADSYQYAATLAGPAPSAQARYTPALPVAAKYDVYLWYPAGSNRTTNAPITIYFDSGSLLTNVNQTVNGGAWQLLAAGLDFGAGTNGFVTVGNNTGESGKVVMADAVRWSYSPGQDNPGDGTVPQWWASFYFGTAVDPSQDHDKDGLSAYAEFVFGTDPTNAVSRLQLRAEGVPPAGLRVAFAPKLADRIYDLQRITNLSAGAWSNVNLVAAADTDGEGVFIITNPPAGPNFYRLAVRLMP